MKFTDKYERILMLTQDEVAVKTILYEDPGLWRLAADWRFWNERVIDKDLTATGTHVRGKKVCLVDQEPEIGLEVAASRVECRKLIPYTVQADYIIKDHFTLPPISIIKNMKSVFVQITDQDVVFAQDHCLAQAFREKAILEKRNYQVRSTIQYVRGKDTAYVIGTYPMAKLMALHDFKKIVLLTEFESQAVTLLNCMNILRCLKEFPGHAIAFDHLQWKCLIHPKTLAQTLMFLRMIGCIIRIDTTNDLIEIKKLKPGALTDRIFDGVHRADELAAALTIPREQMMAELKASEERGEIIFSFANSQPKPFYRLGARDLDGPYFSRMFDMMERDCLNTVNLAMGGEEWLNSHINGKVEQWCQELGIEATIIEQGKETVINPRGLSI